MIAAASRFAIEVRIAGDVRRAPTGANRLTIAAEDTELKYGEGSGAE